MMKPSKATDEYEKDKAKRRREEISRYRRFVRDSHLDLTRIHPNFRNFCYRAFVSEGYYVDFEPFPFEAGCMQLAFNGVLLKEHNGELENTGKKFVVKMPQVTSKFQHLTLLARQKRIRAAAVSSNQRHQKAIELATEWLNLRVTKRVEVAKTFIVKIVKCPEFDESNEMQNYVKTLTDRLFLSSVLFEGACATIENFITGKFVKYLTNEGIVNPRERANLPSAFAHWTWETSGGAYMVCDFQGVRKQGKYMITDPCVHTNKSVVKMNCGPSNLGFEGMVAFFRKHRCNKLCHDLKLQNMVSAILDETRLEEDKYFEEAPFIVNMKDALHMNRPIIKRTIVQTDEQLKQSSRISESLNYGRAEGHSQDSPDMEEDRVFMNRNRESPEPQEARNESEGASEQGIKSETGHKKGVVVKELASDGTISIHPNLQTSAENRMSNEYQSGVAPPRDQGFDIASNGIVCTSRASGGAERGSDFVGECNRSEPTRCEEGKFPKGSSVGVESISSTNEGVSDASAEASQSKGDNGNDVNGGNVIETGFTPTCKKTENDLFASSDAVHIEIGLKTRDGSAESGKSKSSLETKSSSKESSPKEPGGCNSKPEFVDFESSTGEKTSENILEVENSAKEVLECNSDTEIAGLESGTGEKVSDSIPRVVRGSDIEEPAWSENPFVRLHSSPKLSSDTRKMIDQFVESPEESPVTTKGETNEKARDANGDDTEKCANQDDTLMTRSDSRLDISAEEDKSSCVAYFGTPTYEHMFVDVEVAGEEPQIFSSESSFACETSRTSLEEALRVREDQLFSGIYEKKSELYPKRNATRTYPLIEVPALESLPLTHSEPQVPASGVPPSILRKSTEASKSAQSAEANSFLDNQPIDSMPSVIAAKKRVKFPSESLPDTTHAAVPVRVAYSVRFPVPGRVVSDDMCSGYGALSLALKADNADSVRVAGINVLCDSPWFVFVGASKEEAAKRAKECEALGDFDLQSELLAVAQAYGRCIVLHEAEKDGDALQILPWLARRFSPRDGDKKEDIHMVMYEAAGDVRFVALLE